MAERVLITAGKFHGRDAAARQRLAAAGIELVDHPIKPGIDPTTFARLAAGVSAIVAGPERVDATILDAAGPSLKLVHGPGVGYDHIDITAAGERGVAVCTCAGTNAHAVAEMTIGLMLAVARRIPTADRNVKSGQWRGGGPGLQLWGRTIGIVGLGAIGKGVAVRARGMGMRVLAFDARKDVAFALTHGIRYVGFDDLLGESDVVTLHCPLIEQTRGIIDAARLRTIRPHALLLNTARGGLVDEAAVADALKHGRLGGAALDVLEREPIDLTTHPFGDLGDAANRLILTPHCAGATTEAIDEAFDVVIDNVTAALSGGRPINRVN